MPGDRSSGRGPTIAAVVCARNEELHIQRCINDFVRDGVEVILIDHDSDDATRKIAEAFVGHGLLSIERLPWVGRFALEEQLAMKNEIIGRLPHDWVVHADADEWLRPPVGFRSFSEAIREVDSAGFNCVNFSEFVFVPRAHENFVGRNYTKEMLTYYFFEPARPRLMRVWRRDLHATNLSAGGHVLSSAGELRLFPKDFILRHYIVLSHSHAVAKFVSRPYCEAETSRGWHANRLGLRSADLVLKPSTYLRRLPRWNDSDFDFSTPASEHFWHWPELA
jgi:glycosyltransferase involved in cell wall biosynthesis